jgi:hypothetical protein
LKDDDRKLIDVVLSKIPKENGNKLKELSYQTPPMKKLKATLGGIE